MPIIFWSVAALDAALFLFVLLTFSKRGANTSGGYEMGIFYFVVVPGVILAAAVLLFIFSKTDFWRFMALFIVAGPGLIFAGTRIKSFYINHRGNQDRLGRGYFSGADMKAMGEAVVKGDLEAMRRLAPKVDINSVAHPEQSPGMTLMRLAAEIASDKIADKAPPEDLSVIKTLLELGAKPDPGLDAALRIKDETILRVLLEAGADPNMKYDQDNLMVFRWLAVMPVESIRLMAKHGLNLALTERSRTLCGKAIFDDHWDKVSALIDLGADFRKPDESGRTVAGEAEKRLAEAAKEGRTPDPFILEVQAKVLAAK